MKKKRALPYGYTIQNGRRTIEEKEAEVIRRIFADYQDGSSMAELAATMTTLQIPYCEKRVEWNKNIIARILANPRYAGADDFDPIVDMDVFKEVNLSKCSRTTRQHIQIAGTVGMLRAKVLCAECGSRMIKNCDIKKKHPVKWRCENEQCHIGVTLDDEILESRVVDRMNLIIDNPDLLEDADAYTMDDQEVQYRSKIIEDLSRMCDTGHYTDEQLLTFILENARKQYELCPENQGNTLTAVCLAYSGAEHSEKLNTELFLKTVSTILLNQDGSIQLRLISGKII